jgi:ABC-2 type transport system permease protein
MSLRALQSLALKDLKLFLGDRRALLFTFLTPVAIASFFGFLFSGDSSAERGKILVAVADLDRSAVSRTIVAGLARDKNLQVTQEPLERAREQVRKGKTDVAVILPAGFGDASVRALFAGGAKPEIPLLYDPSSAMEVGLVRGLLTQHVMETVSREAMTGSAGRQSIEESLADLERDTAMKAEDRDSLRSMLQGISKWQGRQEQAQTAGEPLPSGGMSIPFEAREEAVTSGSGVRYNGYAHSFAGMGIQWILFAGIELGVGILLERKTGLWKRLRAAPVTRPTLLLGKAASGSLISLMCLAGTFAFGMLVFGIRVLGSVLGFLLLCAASALMASAFGLMLAAVGKTPNATRGIAIMAVLLLVMLGGGWVPAFVFPAWLQTATLAVPTRWAVDGLDAVTWRGLGFGEALPAIGVLLGFTALFAAVAVWRFRWEEE